ncbi:phage holin family protein, partial [Salmonella enterica]|nr:phage holin, lambda family [Salmonella enterica]EEO8663870.1 phage holin, lambda family [Salmonella enterica subsp. enterica serovar Rubislaw]EAS2181139.1 phage holin, lambda family [Salmonella enterica]EAV1253264.1 phage holin, lambda family [Salmonella enterica]EAV1253417.1 phage holin, lambda family [Salmonella enterica]
MNNGPHNWHEWWLLVKDWANGDIPLNGLLITAAIAALRVFYTGKSWRRLLLEV